MAKRGRRKSSRSMDNGGIIGKLESAKTRKFANKLTSGKSAEYSKIMNAGPVPMKISGKSTRLKLG